MTRRAAAMIAACGLAVAGWGSCGAPACDERWVLGGDEACVTTLSGSDALRRGLRGAAPLGPEISIKLDYPVPSTACITMDGVDQPLDVLYVNASGRIVGADCERPAGDPEPRCVDGVLAVFERAPRPSCEGIRGRFARPFGAEPSVEERWMPPVPLNAARCAGDGGGRLTGELTLEVVIDEDVPDATAAAVLGAAAEYWRESGLLLRLDAAPQRMPIGPVIGGIRREYKDRLLAAGLPLDGGDAAQAEAARSLLVSYAMERLRLQLDRYAKPARPHRAVVIVLPEIGAPGSMAEALFERLRGLTFSPALRAAAPPEQQALYDRLGLSDAFTPVVFVGTEPIRELGLDAVDVTLAHEIGHALGLPHVDDPENLMTDRIHRCVPSIDAAQAAVATGYRRWER